jgi:hypothetical protein
MRPGKVRRWYREFARRATRTRNEERFATEAQRRTAKDNAEALRTLRFAEKSYSGGGKTAALQSARFRKRALQRR